MNASSVLQRSGTGSLMAPPLEAQTLRLRIDAARDTLDWLFQEMRARCEYQRGSGSHLSWMLTDLLRRVEAIVGVIQRGEASRELTAEETSAALTECLRGTTAQLRLRYPNFWHELVMTDEGERRLLAFLLERGETS